MDAVNFIKEVANLEVKEKEINVIVNTDCAETINKVKEETEFYIEDVSSENKSKIINSVFQRVINVQDSYGNKLSDNDKENIKCVIKSLLEKNDGKRPLLIDLEMGKGKSLILLEFIKYMCEIDKDYSAIIVKRTIEEAKNFVVSLGFKEKALEFLYEDLRAFYDEETEDNNNEDMFIGMVIRGFNKKDCRNPPKLKNLNNEENQYTTCKDCEESLCKVKSCKWKQKNHRIIVITHARLFMSYENEDLLKEIKDWNNNNCVQTRKQFIIDEKVNMFSNKEVKYKKWVDLKSNLLNLNLTNEIKEQINDADTFISTLNFPDKVNDIIKTDGYNKQFKFNEEVYKLLLAKTEDIKDIETLTTIQKFLNKGGILSKDYKKNNDEIINYCDYVDIAEYYDEEFENFIVLDATSKMDYDYNRSSFNFVNNLISTSVFDVNIFHNSDIQLSKRKLWNNPDYKKGDIFKDYYNKNVELIANDIKEVINKEKNMTLIVVYNEFEDAINNIYSFKQDMVNMLKSLNLEAHYEVVHFGQFTTGVNNFRDFETIIIIGQLNKSTSYYKIKGLCLLDDMSKFEEVRLNEYFIDSIQQIARTAIRQNGKANVYMLGVELELVKGIQRFFKANLYSWKLKNFNEFNIANNNQKSKAWYKIVEFAFKQKLKKGEIIRKKDIENYLIKEFEIPKETFESSLKSKKTKKVLKDYGIIENPNNNREFIKVE